MTTIVASTSAADAHRKTGPGTVTAQRVAKAELVKLRTTRSTLSALITTPALVVGVGIFAAIGTIVEDPPPGDPATADPLGGALAGVSPAAYAIAALGALTVTSEYATGTIRPTLAAVPRRALLVLGKSLALASTTLVIGLVSIVAAYLAARAIVSTGGTDLAFTTAVARALTGAALYLTGVALIASGLGWLLRSTAGALAVLFGVFVLLPVVGFILPEPVAAAIMPYLPGYAGTAITQLDPGGQLGPWTALAVFTAYVVMTLAGATIAVRRRDA
jgi:ABC-type transport system involved in multi-copper enzyme maturation permease subunit